MLLCFRYLAGKLDLLTNEHRLVMIIHLLRGKSPELTGWMHFESAFICRVLQGPLWFLTHVLYRKALGLYKFIRGFGWVYTRGVGYIRGAYKRNKEKMFRNDEINRI